MSGRWSKWWWLSFDLRTWTAEERRIRTELYLIAGAIALVFLWTLDPLLRVLGIEAHCSAAVGGIVGILCGFSATRFVVGILDRNLLRIADENAEKRLSNKRDGHAHVERVAGNE
jgi:small neutral amino acid transporter SnatA (MarC family)